MAEEAGQPHGSILEKNDRKNTKEAEGNRGMSAEEFGMELIGTTKVNSESTRVMAKDKPDIPERGRDDGDGRDTQGLVETQWEWEEIAKLKAAIVPFYRADLSINIFGIPRTLRIVEPKAYEARVQGFSIYYPVDDISYWSNLRKEHTLDHVHSILSRNPEKDFEDYIMAMNDFQDQIRRCHAWEIENPVHIRRLIWAVTRGCQIVDLLLLFYEGRLTMDARCTSVLHLLWVDMLLVENQIPFFVLQRIFDMAVVDKSQFPTFVEIALHFFVQFIDLNKQRPPMESNSVFHLLHLVHSQLLPTETLEPPLSGKCHNPKKFASNELMNLLPRNYSPQQLPISSKTLPSKPFMVKPIPSATRLQEAGVKFKSKEHAGFSNITFKRGVLEIPHLRVETNTKILLRNLIAWEQCRPVVGAYFTSYAIFVDHIINSTKDAEILGQAGILEQLSGGDKEVARVFNGLSTNVVYTGNEDGFLPRLCKELNEYCENKFNLWWAKLMNDYFSNPWSIISLVAAFLLIALTMTQTYYSVYAYARPPKQN